MLSVFSSMDIQDQSNATTPSGLTCRRCGWPFSDPNPNSKQRRDHKRICGTVEGFTKLIDEAVPDDDHEHEHISCYDSDDAEKEKTPSPKIGKKIIKESGSSTGGVEEKPNRSEDDMFSAATEFSDNGISPGVTSEVKKVQEKVPLVEDHDESHEDKVIDQMELSDTIQDQEEEFYEVFVASDIPLVEADIAKTLLEDFKDHKSVHSNVSSDDEQSENGSIVDVFEDKSVQMSIHQESALMENRVKDNLSEADVSHDKHSARTLGELIEAEIKQAEVDHTVPVLTESAVSGLKDSVGSSETVVGEGSGKVLTGQDSGVGVSFYWSSNSLEGIWGSVSDISDVFVKSERRLDRTCAFKDSSLVDSEEELVEQNASEVNAVKVQKSQSPKSATNEAAIAKVTNWSTSGHIATTPLRKLMGEANSPNPKPSSSLIKKDEEDAESGQPGKSNLTQETPVVNQETSSVMNSGEGKLVKKKIINVRSSFGRFVCCTEPVTK